MARMASEGVRTTVAPVPRRRSTLCGRGDEPKLGPEFERISKVGQVAGVKVIPNSAVLEAERPLECVCECVGAGLLASSVRSALALGRAVEERTADEGRAGRTAFPVPRGLGADVRWAMDRDGREGMDGRGGSGGTAGMSMTGPS
jgi:hypothetical protein